MCPASHVWFEQNRGVLMCHMCNVWTHAFIGGVALEMLIMAWREFLPSNVFIFDHVLHTFNQLINKNTWMVNINQIITKYTVLKVPGNFDSQQGKGIWWKNYTLCPDTRMQVTGNFIHPIIPIHRLKSSDWLRKAWISFDNVHYRKLIYVCWVLLFLDVKLPKSGTRWPTFQISWFGTDQKIYEWGV